MGELKAKELLSKQRYYYTDVRKKFISVAKIINNFQNPKITKEILSEVESKSKCNITTKI